MMLLLGGCGYTWSEEGASALTSSESGAVSKSLYRQDVRTVAAPIFTNRTYYRGIEFNLSKAIVNQLESRTPYKVVPRERADTILEGQIESAGVHSLSRSPFNALPQEQLYYIAVTFTWKDLRSGKILVQRHNFEQTAPYYPTLGESQFFGSQDNIEKLAIAIVEELQADWGGIKPQ